jgi:hypothetical protein
LPRNSQSRILAATILAIRQRLDRAEEIVMPRSNGLIRNALLASGMLATAVRFANPNYLLEVEVIAVLPPKA